MTFRTTTRLLAVPIAVLVPMAPALAQDQISVMSFGGAYQDAQRAAVFDTYAAETGIQVIEQEYGGEIARIKAMIDSGTVTIDAVDVDAPTLLQGCDDGIFELVDWSRFGPEEDWIEGTTSECGVGTIVYATTLAYDGARHPDGPTVLADLFDTEAFPGKRGLWKNPATNLEFALLADGVPADEVYDVLSTPEGLDRAFAKLEAIKEHIVWWEAGAQAPQLLASGEVAMTTAWNGRIHNANLEGQQFRIVWDNQILDSNFWAIPKGARDVDAAHDFIVHAVKPEVLAGITAHIPYGPVRTSAAEFVAPEDAANLPTSPENLTVALTLDNAFWADNGDEIRRRFTTWLSQ